MDLGYLIVNEIWTLKLAELEFFLRSFQLSQHGLQYRIAVIIGRDGA
jgi:hypothetical protein